MRDIRPYNQWMLQRPLDHYQCLSGREKERADDFLIEVGGYEAMQANIRRRVKRVNY